MADSKTVVEEPSFDDESAEYDRAMAQIPDALLDAPPNLSVMHSRFGAAPSTLGGPSDVDRAAAQRAIDQGGERSKSFGERVRHLLRYGRR